MKKYPFYTALTQLSELYGIELDEDTFETYALSAYNKIGNKYYRVKLLKASPICDIDGGWYVCRPDDCDTIEAITLNFESAQESSSTSDYYGLFAHDIELWIETNKRIPNELYIPGKLIKFKEIDDKIYFTEPFREVNILYKAQITDDNGLPYLSEKELEAVVAYCAYAHDFKQGRLTRDSGTLQIAQIEEQKWKLLCSAARTPEEINQNVVNELLDIMVSYNVHHHGASSTKPIQ